MNKEARRKLYEEGIQLFNDIVIAAQTGKDSRDVGIKYEAFILELIMGYKGKKK